MRYATKAQRSGYILFLLVYPGIAGFKDAPKGVFLFGGNNLAIGANLALL
jgi:hypothetical protein